MVRECKAAHRQRGIYNSQIKMCELIIGLTGGIGAGKSVISRICRGRGYAVYDCDSEAKRIMDSSESMQESLRCRFGNECFTDEGRIDRKFLASKIFGNEQHRLWLNTIVHASVKEDVAAWAAALPGKICFVESAVLHESGLDRFSEAIWLVDAPEELRIERVIHRNGTTSEEVRSRIASQSNEFEMLPAAKVCTILNDDVHPLLPQIDKLLNDINSII